MENDQFDVSQLDAEKVITEQNRKGLKRSGGTAPSYPIKPVR